MKTPALFVSHAQSLRPAGGGVQRCTREYQETLRAAGFELQIESYETSRRLPDRLRRRFFPKPHRHCLPNGFGERCAQAVRESRLEWVFLNHSDTGPLAAELGRLRPRPPRCVMLSHGLDSTDYLHTPGHRPARLGELLETEKRERPGFAAIFCLSEVDVQIERWLGAQRVCLLPRIVEDRPLRWEPVPGRIGTVATLGHPPNDDGLEQFCAALESGAGEPVRLELVGGPRDRGEALARRHPSIDYLGPLDDGELERRASSWSAFANPIFCFARGCSTKLALPLGWRLPIATTRAGARGYYWDESISPLADTPAQLAELAKALARAPGPAAQRGVEQVAAKSPRLADVARLVRATLDPLR